MSNIITSSLKTITPSLKGSLFAAATYGLARCSKPFKVLHDSYNALSQISNAWKMFTGEQPLPTTTDYVLFSLKLAMQSATVAVYLVSNSFHLALGCGVATALSYATSRVVDFSLGKIQKRLDQLQAEDKSSGDVTKNSEEIKNLTSIKDKLESLKYYVDGAHDASLGITKYFISLYLMTKAEEYIEKGINKVQEYRNKDSSEKKAADQKQDNKSEVDNAKAEPQKAESEPARNEEQQAVKAEQPKDQVVDQVGRVDEPKVPAQDQAQPLEQQVQVLPAQKQAVSAEVAQHGEQVLAQAKQIENSKPIPAPVQQVEQPNHELVVQNQPASAVQKPAMSGIEVQSSVQAQQLMPHYNESFVDEQAVLQLQHQVAQQGLANQIQQFEFQQHLQAVRDQQFVAQQHMLSVQTQQFVAQQQHAQLAQEQAILDQAWQQAAQQPAQHVLEVPKPVVQSPLPPVVEPIEVPVDNLLVSDQVFSNPQPFESLPSSAQVAPVKQPVLEAPEESHSLYQGTIREIGSSKVQDKAGVTVLKYVEGILFSTPQGTNDHTMVYIDPVYPLGEVMQFLPNMMLKSSL